ncbi:MAG TPA: hypothetical protein VHE10_02155 [Candidatus Paceibacterota bacterium]|nr:hypothetical protein [Candidatus Paceibacterota bacterium]
MIKIVERTKRNPPETGLLIRRDGIWRRVIQLDDRLVEEPYEGVIFPATEKEIDELLARGVSPYWQAFGEVFYGVPLDDISETADVRKIFWNSSLGSPAWQKGSVPSLPLLAADVIVCRFFEHPFPPGTQVPVSELLAGFTPSEKDLDIADDPHKTSDLQVWLTAWAAYRKVTFSESLPMRSLLLDKLKCALIELEALARAGSSD